MPKCPVLLLQYCKSNTITIQNYLLYASNNGFDNGQKSSHILRILFMTMEIRVWKNSYLDDNTVIDANIELQ